MNALPETIANNEETKLGGFDALEKFRDNLRASCDTSCTVIRLCSTGCKAKGSDKIAEAFKRVIAEKGLADFEALSVAPKTKATRCETTMLSRGNDSRS